MTSTNNFNKKVLQLFKPLIIIISFILEKHEKASSEIKNNTKKHASEWIKKIGNLVCFDEKIY